MNEHIIPGWSGFNTIIFQDVTPPPLVSRILYLPVIDVLPTEFATIHTNLKRCTETLDRSDGKMTISAIVLLYNFWDSCQHVIFVKIFQD